MEEKRSSVSETTKQERDTRQKWHWVEPSVWTDKMLTALERCAKGELWIIFVISTKPLIIMGFSHYPKPIRNYVGLLNEETISGEPYAGEPLVRFGGRGVQ